MKNGATNRKYKRSDLEIELYLHECQGNDKIKVELLDISQGGLGFNYSEKIEIGTFFNADIRIWTKEIIPAIIKIVRCESLMFGDGYNYGSEFIIISDTDKFRIATYQLINE